MSTAAASATPTAAACDDADPRQAAPARLDGLLELDAAALAKLYAAARVPRIADLSGDLRGRMLALSELPAALTRAAGFLGRQSWFPWRGKSFHADASGSGGVNRVLVDRLKLFTFDTFVGPSRAGVFDAVQLDYDKPGNPAFIRAVKDEVREIRPGLYLGQAYWQWKDAAPRLVLYFGLERA
jgi:hypothetical protein